MSIVIHIRHNIAFYNLFHNNFITYNVFQVTGVVTMIAIRIVLVIVLQFLQVVRMEPKCYWRLVSTCNTLKCVEVDSEILESNLSSIVHVHGDFDDFLLGRNSRCFVLEVTHSELNEIAKLPLKHTDEYLEMRFVGVHLKQIEENVFNQFKNLQSITLKRNDIRTLRLANGLQKLINLDISNNLISNLNQNDLPKIITLKSFDASYNRLETIDSVLCNFEALERLDVSNNNLKRISDGIGCNKNLASLNLAFNEMEVLKAKAILDLPRLETCYLNDNKLSTVESRFFSKMSSLRSLYLHDNKLRIINSTTFAGLTNLKHITLDNNSMITIKPDSFSDMHLLTHLSLRQNQLRVLQNNTFKGLTNLRGLVLNNMDIWEIQNGAFNGLDNLMFLNLRNSNIFEINSNALVGMPSLIYLNLRNNSFFLRPFTFRSLSKLKNLYLEKYNQSYDYFLVTDSFVGLESLTTLDLSHFNIDYINDGAFNGLNDLIELNVSHNSLMYLGRDVFVGMPKLEIIDLSNNRIQKINRDAFYELSNVVTFDISNNNISSLEAGGFVGLTKLKVLDLSGLYVESVTVGAFQGMDNLEDLILSRNLIVQVRGKTFSGLDHLLKLHLDGNNITYIEGRAFSGLNSLTVLNISGNCISHLNNYTFSGLKNIKELNLANLSISKIDGLAFEGLDSLLLLNLSYNVVEKLEEGTFECLHEIETLDLFGNKIKTIEGNSFKGLVKLTNLNLLNNSLPILLENSFNGLSSIVTLNLSGLRIENIDPGAFDGLGKMEILDLQGNFVQVLKDAIFKGLSKLRILYINSGLKMIYENTFEALPSVYFLRVVEANLSEFRSGTVKGIPNLKLLHFKDVHFGAIQKDAFVGTSLRTIYLENCTIDSIESYAFSNLNSLEIIRLLNEYAYISNTYFNFSRLSLKVIQPRAFTNSESKIQSNVNTFHFEHNDLTTIFDKTFVGLDDLESLFLDNNKITTIELGAFGATKNLRLLVLSNNNLKKIQPGVFKGLDNLHKLHLDNNSISTLFEDSFGHLSSVIVINLENNKIEELASNIFIRTPNLIGLNLNRNYLKSLPAQLICPRLEFLSLSYNSFTDFDLNVLKSMPKVKSVFLKGNRLSDLNVDLLREVKPNITSFDITDNHFSCTNLTEIIKKMRKYRLPYVRKSSSHQNSIEGVDCLNEISYRETDTTRSLSLSMFVAALNDTNENVKVLIDKNNRRGSNAYVVTKIIEGMIYLHDRLEKHVDVDNDADDVEEIDSLGTFQIVLIVICALICVGQIILICKTCFRKNNKRPIPENEIQLINAAL